MPFQAGFHAIQARRAPPARQQRQGMNPDQEVLHPETEILPSGFLGREVPDQKPVKHKDSMARQRIIREF